MLIDNLYYKSVKTKDNITYSIDMLRLKTYIKYFDFKELEFFFNSYYKDKIKKFWCSDRPMCFHYNYVIEVEEGISFYFGFMHNSETVSFHKDCKEYNFTIEFNPNKLKNNFILLHILHNFNNWVLKSFDCAMDISVGIMDIIFDVGNRRKLITRSNGGDDITYSVGQGNGRYKIYNKKKESSLDIAGNLTRVEVSFEFEDFPISDVIFFEVSESFLPDVYLNEYVYSLSDVTTKDATLSALLYAVQHGYPIKQLSRKYKEKIKELLKGGSKISFDKKYVEECFRKCIYAYFDNNSKQWFK